MKVADNVEFGQDWEALFGELSGVISLAHVEITDANAREVKKALDEKIEEVRDRLAGMGRLAGGVISLLGNVEERRGPSGIARERLIKARKAAQRRLVGTDLVEEAGA
jgi:hypothetical protein